MDHGKHDITDEMLAEAMGVPTEASLLGLRRQRAQQMYGTPLPQGMNAGGTYIAASPLSHIAAAMMRYQGAKGLQDVDRRSQDMLARVQAANAAAMQEERGPIPQEWNVPQGLRRSEAVKMLLKRPAPDPLLADKQTKLRLEAERLQNEPKERNLDRASRERAARLSADLRSRGLDIQKERADASKEQADAKRRMVSDSQVKAISDYDRGIRIMEDLIREKPQIDTGPLANARNAIAQKTGIDDPQVTAYKAQVNDFLAQYIRSISGAATTDKERAFLLQNMPKLSDNDAQFQAKAQKTIQRLRELRKLEVDLIRRQGKDTGAFEEAPVVERGPGMPEPGSAPAAASMGDPLGIR